MKAQRIGVVFVGLLLAGCSGQMAGTWYTTEIRPAGAADEFPFETITFRRDGTYVAESTRSDQIERSSGTWTYNMTGLHLIPYDGEARSFRATVWMSKKLEASGEHDGRTVTIRMEKHQPKAPESE